MKDTKLIGLCLLLGLSISTTSVYANTRGTSAAFYNRYKDNVSAVPLPQCAEKTSSLTRIEMQEILLEHNRARMDADRFLPRRESPLPVVRWHCPTAAIAQKWADGEGDIQGHSPKEWREQEYSRRTGLQGRSAKLGENLAWAASTSPTRVGSVVKGVVDWDAERDDYRHSSSTCKSGKVCGHYTQIVWRESTKVGCGVKRDQIRFPGGGRIYPYGYFLSCNYHNRGNINGDNPLITHPAFYYR